MEGYPNKKYGLIFPKNNHEVLACELTRPLSVFRDSDDSEEEPACNWMQKALKKEKYSGARNKYFKTEMQKNMKEDPTIYQYDELYDEMNTKRQEALAIKQIEKLERKPKYIKTLMATAEKRKKENERRIARQIQKEREAEGEEFADKEVFVTSAYKKKLEEMKVAEEEEKEQDRLEAIGDVTKQGDLSGFYRHLYEKIVLDVEDDEKSEQPLQKKQKKENSKFSRQYRKRKSSESNDEAESIEPYIDCVTDEIAAENNPTISTNQHANLDKLKNTNDAEHKNENSNEIIINQAEGTNNNEKKSEKQDKHDQSEKSKSEDVKKYKDAALEKVKPKINIWKKRTVGEVLEAALQRYFKRKANIFTNHF